VYSMYGVHRTRPLAQDLEHQCGHHTTDHSTFASMKLATPFPTRAGTRRVNAEGS
jgi:hypothetical protein